MTQKTIDYKPNGQQQKMPGWFSWRHKTRDAHNDAREAYLANHGPVARQIRADEREGQRQAEGTVGTNHTNTRGHALGRCSCTPSVRAA